MVEFAYKYNYRSSKSTFEKTIAKSVEDDKCLVGYKPKKNVKRITNPEKRKKGC